MTEMRSAGERHSFRPHLDGRPRAFTKMLYPFVKKLPKGPMDNLWFLNRTKEENMRQTRGFYYAVRLL
jgi:hypothetical protein